MSQVKKVMIPKSVTSIGMIAFQDCSLLSSIAIPEGITSIEERAFERCSTLVSFTIPNSVNTIGDGAFLGCFKMSTVTIGNGVKSIGKAAFDCKNLSNIVLLIKNPFAIGGKETFSWPFIQYCKLEMNKQFRAQLRGVIDVDFFLYRLSMIYG